MSLTDPLRRACAQHPGKTALICAGRRFSYQQWQERSARLAGVLLTRGVSAGDRVAVLAANSDDYAVIYTGLWWLGAVACPVNTRWSDLEIAYSLRDCGVQTLIVDSAHGTQVAALQRQVPDLRDVLCIGPPAAIGAEALAAVTALEPLLAAASPIDDRRVNDSQLAALLYTGGTTGEPKGVMLSHGNLVAAVQARIDASPSLADSVALISMPLFHVAGLTRLLTHLFSGSCCVVLPQFRAAELLDVLEAEGVTDLSLVPSMLQTLLDEPQFDARRLRSLQRFNYGAAPISDALVLRMRSLLPHIGFSQAYGLTECAALASMGNYLNTPTRSAGRACGSVELKILAPDGTTLPPGSTGEIALRGANIMQGYWGKPMETAQALRDGWLFTGDAGYLDADGNLYVVDRLKDMIITGGENVYSTEVENALLQHPAVQSCAVFGVPSERWGEAVHAVVVKRASANIDEASLREHCRAQIAGYKCPKSIEFADSLPVTPAGKVAKQLLRQRHSPPPPTGFV